MSTAGSGSATDYVSLSLIIVCAIFFTLLYFWKRGLVLSSASIMFWFTAAGMWLFTTTTPTTSLIFWGLGIIMVVYTVVESIMTLRGKGVAEDEEYEETGIDA